jgi:hypothetical protein
MTRLRVSTKIPAPIAEVWADLSRLETHVEWMRDAESITFTSASTSGVGTTFDCATKVGPFRLNDRMEITSWTPKSSIGVRHTGLVTGSGTLQLRPTGRRRRATKVVWSERLHFPWWFGGPIGAAFARPVLWLVWRSSMKALRQRFERESEPAK